MEFIITPEHGGKTNVTDKPFPIISCICVTRNKPAMLRRAIACFAAQVYEPKELIIVFEEDDLSTAALVASDSPHWEANVRLVKVPADPKTSLGELRNIGISAACGEFISQWDDDDWYHKDRLAYQYKALIKNGRDCTVMMHWMLFDCVDQRAYISHSRTWEGSILCRKTVLQQKPYADRASAEDTPVVEYLASTGCMHLMENEPGLYIYTYHGNNTWDREHFKEFFNLGKPLSDRDSTEISEILNAKYPVHQGSRLLDELLTRHNCGTAGKELLNLMLVNTKNKRKEYLPLTPSQKWCLWEMGKLKHPGWCTVEFLVKTREPMHESVMRAAVNHVVNKYETLRVKFANQGAEWFQEVYPAEEADAFAAYDLSGEGSADRQEQMKKICIKERDWLLPERGNLVRVLFFKFSAVEGRIWFCLHHVISDFVSSVIFSGDFMTAYKTLFQGRELRSVTVKDHRKMLYLLDGYCRDVLLPAELDYWTAFPWDKAVTLPSDYPERFPNDAAIMDAINNKKLLDAYKTDIVLADEELTMRMFGRFGTDLENALIATFFLGVSRTMNLKWMDMNVCNSGRNILPPDYGINFFHLMGFLAVNRVVMLNRPGSNDLTSDFHQVIEQIKNIPNAGIGYHLLGHYIKNEELRNSFMSFRRRPFVFFNYLGRIDSNLGNEPYEIVDEDCGLGSYENEIQNNMLECFAGIKENQLFFKFTYCDAYIKRETIQEIKQAIAETMRALAPARADQFIEKVA